jgi:hypothetical protein
MAGGGKRGERERERERVRETERGILVVLNENR